NEPIMLEAVIQPGNVQVIADPRVSATDGRVNQISLSRDRRTVRIEFQPQGGSIRDPNMTISVAWTIRTPETDTVVVARGFVHAREEGGFAFDYETPRATIAEMAAPPISQGPKPGP